MQGISDATITEAFQKIKQKNIETSLPAQTSPSKDFLASNVAPAKREIIPPQQASPSQPLGDKGASQFRNPASQVGRPERSVPEDIERKLKPTPTPGSILPADKPVLPTRPDLMKLTGESSAQPTSPIDKSSRLEYASKKGLGLTFWLIVVIVLLLGFGSIGYLYFDEIYNAVFKPTTIEESKTEKDVSFPVVIEEPIVEEEVVVEEQKDVNLLKTDLIKQAQIFLADKFKADGVYPKTYNIADDSDSFYCYRKNGAHYVLGTILDPSISSGVTALAADLDGDYYCGDVVKKCADPIYCVGPESQ